ncbi:hypothetical protein G7085_06855 [Tessaracoccus sp. HDW20]|uniref:hypothetical protein n=1 Tax=Tessaracoccus coleopterorum TaxID=2714950 RepID=UPI0018D31161|nr:hypothetical protein [Tessaracoccus coleopterorum]NHB84416.1 hypothetical protein [Tessaracoccus coleopterorum]
MLRVVDLGCWVASHVDPSLLVEVVPGPSRHGSIVAPYWSLAMKARKTRGAGASGSTVEVMPQWGLVLKTRNTWRARSGVRTAGSPQWSLAMKARETRASQRATVRVEVAAMEPGHEGQEDD